MLLQIFLNYVIIETLPVIQKGDLEYEALYDSLFAIYGKTIKQF